MHFSEREIIFELIQEIIVLKKLFNKCAKGKQISNKIKIILRLDDNHNKISESTVNII